MAHGSMQYWPHRRAHNRLPRLRNHPVIKEPLPCNIVAYKVGMTHLTMIDDTESPSKNAEVAKACTVLEIPKMEVYGMRFYSTNGLTNYKEVKTELYNKALAQKLNIKKLKHDETKIGSMKEKLKEYSNITALIVAFPKGLSVEQHHVMRFESPLGGNTIEEKFEFITKALGTEIKINEIFKPGEYVDITSISKGKGWQGPIKRLHVKRNAHKGTGKIRHGGPLGAFSPGKVFYTVPRAGQLGFNYRTEHNKRILKIGQKTEIEAVNKRAGYSNYGLVKNEYIIISGSVVGPAKRLVRIRKSIRHRNMPGIKEPKVMYIAR
jgi:large subunit ribosomal protein L3